MRAYAAGTHHGLTNEKYALYNENTRLRFERRYVEKRIQENALSNERHTLVPFRGSGEDRREPGLGPLI